ncbi:unnamed protein product [Sphenostylis stenocarpa]|uniref:Pectinesterase inhibitor domain-containing protein n=1 Tax=Sphenostylis stenocarpa TaxID=92480 RepID=A0AA86VP62_9FABA|nr:unnamed protein product [Sphenostylis stenocarpa]
MDYQFTPKTSLTLFVTLSFFIILTNAVPSNHDIHYVSRDILADISTLCAKTTDPPLCVQTIKPHFSDSSLEPLKALDVEVDATLDGAKKTLQKIHTLESKKGNNKSTKDSLNTCEDQYSSMLDAIAETKAAIKKNDVITAKFKFSAVLSYQAACQDSFNGKDPFREDSQVVFNLGGIALDIIAAIEKAMGPPRTTPVQQGPSSFSSVIGTVS